MLHADDPSRVYTTDEQRRLTTQLLALVRTIHDGSEVSRACTLDLLCEYHRRLFDGVRDHAGLIRRAGFGSDTLTYGPNRSPTKEEVPNLMLDCFRQISRSLQSFDAHPDAEDHERNAIHLAVWAHAEVVRIHPFEDGNGRTARLLMNWLLVRLGLRPISVEVVKEEYRDCLNHFYRTRDIDPLLDLMIRLY